MLALFLSTAQKMCAKKIRLPGKIGEKKGFSKFKSNELLNKSEHLLPDTQKYFLNRLYFPFILNLILKCKIYARQISFTEVTH